LPRSLTPAMFLNAYSCNSHPTQLTIAIHFSNLCNGFGHMTSLSNNSLRIS
jgi:hypothetical protein